MSDRLSWKDMSAEELFMVGKWQESRAEAFKEIIAMLTIDPEPVKYEIATPQSSEADGADGGR